MFRQLEPKQIFYLKYVSIMNYFNKLLLFSLALSLTGCQVIHLLGTKKRDNEDKEEIRTFLAKKKITSFDYSIKEVDSLGYLINSSEKHALNLAKLEMGQEAGSAVELRVYKPNGELENAYAQCFGPFKKLNILDSYPPRKIAHLPINYDLKFRDELDIWDIDAGTKEAILAESQDNTYTFVLYWNIWTNHFSKVVLKEMEKYITEHESDDARFLYVLVNNSKDID